MPQFLERFGNLSSHASGSGFGKGLLTAMIEMGALIEALNLGWIADRCSHENSIAVAAVIFIVGSVLQTAAMNYAMLTVAFLIGGLGIGMLSMVAPLYISKISPPETSGALLVLEDLGIVSGIVIAFWITYVTRYIGGEWSWRLPFPIQIGPAVLFGSRVLFSPFGLC